MNETLSSMRILLFFTIRIFLLIFSQEISAARDDSLTAYFETIKQSFDKQFPPPPYPRNNISEYKLEFKTLNNQQMQNIHDKRCFLTENSQAIDYYLKSNFGVNQDTVPLLVATPCIGSDSLGNNLGSYFENLVCAQFVGLHYFSLAHIWEPKSFDQPTHFLEKIPNYVIHSSPTSDIKLSKAKLKKFCLCPGSCHERGTALWIKGLSFIKPILMSAVSNHLSNLFINSTIVRAEDISNVPVGAVLPLIPEAAIHYRCGDNFVGHYGFLPFRAFTQTIPKNVSTLYVLAENRGRKTNHRPHLAAICDSVFQNLYRFLSAAFPKVKVLIRRGDDLYTDFARLALAKNVVCSVSTFCLWPAVMNANSQHVFFPRTKLIVGGDVNINLGFQWLTAPSIILGKHFLSSPPSALLKQLITENNVN
jgi:hypothetical protein